MIDQMLMEKAVVYLPRGKFRATNEGFIFRCTAWTIGSVVATVCGEYSEMLVWLLNDIAELGLDCRLETHLQEIGEFRASLSPVNNDTRIFGGNSRSEAVLRLWVWLKEGGR